MRALASVSPGLKAVAAVGALLATTTTPTASFVTRSCATPTGSAPPLGLANAFRLSRARGVIRVLWAITSKWPSFAFCQVLTSFFYFFFFFTSGTRCVGLAVGNFAVTLVFATLTGFVPAPPGTSAPAASIFAALGRVQETRCPHHGHWAVVMTGCPSANLGTRISLLLFVYYYFCY